MYFEKGYLFISQEQGRNYFMDMPNEIWNVKKAKSMSKIRHSISLITPPGMGLMIVFFKEILIGFLVDFARFT